MALLLMCTDWPLVTGSPFYTSLVERWGSNLSSSVCVALTRPGELQQQTLIPHGSKPRSSG